MSGPIEALVSHNHTTTTMIERLPVEIFHMIFTMAFPPPEQICYIERARPQRVVMQICHYWRRIAKSVPKLWSNIFIDAAQSDLELVDYQVELSGNSPLSVLLYAEDDNISEDAVAFVLKHQHQIASLCLNGLQGLFTRFSGEITAHQFEEIHLHSTDWLDLHPDSHIDLPVAPRRVTLEIVPFEDVRIDWNNVSSLQITADYVEGALPRFDLAGRLKKLDLLLDNWGPPDNPSIIVNSSIEELSVKGMCGAEIVMTTMSLPSLKILRINIVDITRFTERIWYFLQRCDLEVMDVQERWVWINDSLGTSALITLLDTTKKLRELIISEVSERLLSKLVDVKWLPGLQRISLSAHFDCDDDPSDFFTYLDLIGRRQSLVLTLTLSFDEEATDLKLDVMDRIKKMRASGNNIFID